MRLGYIGLRDSSLGSSPFGILFMTYDICGSLGEFALFIDYCMLNVLHGLSVWFCFKALQLKDYSRLNIYDQSQSKFKFIQNPRFKKGSNLNFGGNYLT